MRWRRAHFGREARTCVKRGIAIASDHRHAGVGSEHLLLGVAENDQAGAVLESLGVDLDQLRQLVLQRIEDRGGDPDGPDPSALAGIGIDMAEVHRRTDGISDPVRWHRRRSRARFTHEARVALHAAVPVTGDRRERVISATHMLAGLAVCRSSRARDVLAQLDVSPTDLLALVD